MNIKLREEIQKIIDNKTILDKATSIANFITDSYQIKDRGVLEEQLKFEKELGLLGGAIPHSTATLQVNRAHTRRHLSYQNDRPVPQSQLEKSVYFSQVEIENWLEAIRAIDTNRFSTLGIRLYFSEYQDRRSSIVLRAMYLDGSTIVKVPTNLGADVTYNLGGLCPPGCTPGSEDV